MLPELVDLGLLQAECREDLRRRCCHVADAEGADAFGIAEEVRQGDRVDHGPVIADIGEGVVVEADCGDEVFRQAPLFADVGSESGMFKA